MFNKLRIAIIGSGNIGTDLLIKCMRSKYLECVCFIGRNSSSPGLIKARSLQVTVSDQSIRVITQNPDNFDLVFDATSASEAIYNWSQIKPLGIQVIDLTPAKQGIFCIPALNISEAITHQNINMVTCGGQASAPIAHVISQVVKDIEYIEVVSSIASKSAGPATRLNLDEYIETTEAALHQFSCAKITKSILNLNPAFPCIDMQTTIFAKVAHPNMMLLVPELKKMIAKINYYVPGYQLLVEPVFENHKIAVIVKVQGLGDHLPKYAGNLDIINCAAIEVAEKIALTIKKPKSKFESNQNVRC